MQAFVTAFESAAHVLVVVSATLAGVLALTVVIERAVFAWWSARRSRLERTYGPMIARALDGDDEAERRLAAAPRRHRFLLAELLFFPVLDRRDWTQVARVRATFQAMNLPALADGYLKSWQWWRRAMALRAVGFLQLREYTPTLVAALDDRHPEIRAAALDGLADSGDPAALAAIVVRLNDETLHRGRRAAALAAFGSGCEPMLLDLAAVDATNWAAYADALAITGTAAARPVLSSWIADARPAVRVSALHALRHTGLDAPCVAPVLAALEDADARVRAAAARALRDATDARVAGRLAAHLTDTWPVCANAAKALRGMGTEGRVLLEKASARNDLAGTLARQMLWEEAAQW
jgi:HEAT repeat protein